LDAYFIQLNQEEVGYTPASSSSYNSLWETTRMTGRFQSGGISLVYVGVAQLKMAGFQSVASIFFACGAFEKESSAGNC
jgi:hypothetical protein